MTQDWQQGGFGIYIHWPFCHSKCPYCDFNSHVAQNVDQDVWLRALLREIRTFGDLTAGRAVKSVFFGGGTPSLMQARVVEAIIDGIGKTWSLANDCEITLEANPGSVEVERFRGYRAGGVNRISMGFQSLNDSDLRRLGRLHTVADAYKAYDTATGVFDRVSFDLIYARQDQSLKEWEIELSKALEMGPDHLSLYQLTVEPDTAFGDRHAKGLLRGLPDESLSADLYLLTQDLCNAAGLPAYEVSNHAKIGAESRHNLIYWSGGDYVGIGPGAHGRVTQSGKRFATDAIRSPGGWLSAASEGSTTKWEELGQDDRAYEYLIMGMRVDQGIDLSRLASISGKTISKSSVSNLTDLGLIKLEDGRIRATLQGRMLLNAVIAELSNFE